MKLPPLSFYPAWSLRQDGEEQARLALLCLDPRGSLSPRPAAVGTAAWWGAVDGGVLAVRVRCGRLLRAEGRPGDPPASVVLRERDGTETVQPANADRASPWRLNGRLARVTAVLHPRRPGRGEGAAEVQLLFELLTPPGPRQPGPARG